MAATKSRTRRCTTTKPAPLGRTTWVILAPNGDVLRENSFGPGANLAVAQQLVGRDECPAKLTIERRDLFGAPARLYRVVRDEDGNAYTAIISQED